MLRPISGWLRCWRLALIGPLMLGAAIDRAMDRDGRRHGRGTRAVVVDAACGSLRAAAGLVLGSAAMTPLLYPVLVYAVVNSAFVTLRQGGVRWRDTFYPLDILRKGNVR